MWPGLIFTVVFHLISFVVTLASCLPRRQARIKTHQCQRTARGARAYHCAMTGAYRMNLLETLDGHSVAVPGVESIDGPTFITFP